MTENSSLISLILSCLCFEFFLQIQKVIYWIFKMQEIVYLIRLTVIYS